MAAYRPEIDDAFRALADFSRRRLLDSLNAQNGQTLRELCAEMDMARQSVSKHLAVLEAAQLVTIVGRGREKLHYLNPAPINEISERWINQYDRDRVRALSDLKRDSEREPSSGRCRLMTCTACRTIEFAPQLLDETLEQRIYAGPVHLVNCGSPHLPSLDEGAAEH